MVLEVGVEAGLAVLVGAQQAPGVVGQRAEHEVGAPAGGVEVVRRGRARRRPRPGRRSPARSRRSAACRRGRARRAWRGPRRGPGASPASALGLRCVDSPSARCRMLPPSKFPPSLTPRTASISQSSGMRIRCSSRRRRGGLVAGGARARRGSAPGSRRRSGPPRPRSRRRGRSRSRPRARASRAASSPGSPRRRGGSARGRAPASRAGRRGPAGRCRRASSRSGGRASRRRPSSGRSRRRAGRRCRPAAIASRVRSTTVASRRGPAAAPAPRPAGTWGRRRSRRARGRRAPRSRADRLLQLRRLGRLGLGSIRPTAPSRARVPLGALADLLAFALEGVDDRFHHHPEARHAAAVVRREVGAAVEGHAVGVEEDGHRPAAVAGHRLHRLHVDRVDVGALLAVDLDADEVLVHVGGGRLVLEGLALHHVAPVAGRVADREQDRPVLASRPRQRLVAPRVPVDGVVAVLQEIGAGLLGKSVAHRFSAYPAHARAGQLFAPAGSPKFESRGGNGPVCLAAVTVNQYLLPVENLDTPQKRDPAVEAVLKKLADEDREIARGSADEGREDRGRAALSGRPRLADGAAESPPLPRRTRPATSPSPLATAARAR